MITDLFDDFVPADKGVVKLIKLSANFDTVLFPVLRRHAGVSLKTRCSQSNDRNLLWFSIVVLFDSVFLKRNIIMPTGICYNMRLRFQVRYQTAGGISTSKIPI